MLRFRRHSSKLSMKKSSASRVVRARNEGRLESPVPRKSTAFTEKRPIHWPRLRNMKPLAAA